MDKKTKKYTKVDNFGRIIESLSVLRGNAVFRDKFIFIVDDQVDDIHTLSYYFKKYGLKNIQFATSVASGLKQLSELVQKPDVVLVDYYLVNEGGPHFIKEAMKVCSFDSVRFELMTGRDLDNLAPVIALHKGAVLKDGTDDLENEVVRFLKAYL